MDKHCKKKEQSVKTKRNAKKKNTTERKVNGMPATAQVCENTSREQLMMRAKALHRSITSRMKSAGFTNEEVKKDVKEAFLDASNRNSDTDRN